MMLSFFLGSRLSPSSDILWFDKDFAQTKLVHSSGFYHPSIVGSKGYEIMDPIFVEFNIKLFVTHAFRPNNDEINACFKSFFLTKY